MVAIERFGGWDPSAAAWASMRTLRRVDSGRRRQGGSTGVLVSVEAVGSAAFEHGRSLAGNYAGSFRATRDVVRSGMQLGPEMGFVYGRTNRWSWKELTDIIYKGRRV